MTVKALSSFVADMNLKEFARTLGLSQTTVSRALGGYPEVSAATRKRVQAEAVRLGYAPNRGAQRLATGRAMAIGHVVPLGPNPDIVNPIFADFLAGAGETCAAAKYEMVIAVTRHGEEADAYREMAMKGSVDGVIVHSPQIEDGRIALLRDIGLPFLVHGRSSGVDAPYSWFDVNNRRAFFRATRFLTDLGHERIALINGPEEMDFAHRRRLGYEEALLEVGLTVDETIMTSDEMTEPYGYRAACAALQTAVRPTAFLVSSIISAMGVRRAIVDAGLAPGRDVSIVTHDDDLSYLSNRGDVPLFTATRSSIRAAGRRCGELLIRMIAAGEGAPPVTELWESELTLGVSTGPAPQ